MSYIVITIATLTEFRLKYAYWMQFANRPIILMIVNDNSYIKYAVESHGDLFWDLFSLSSIPHPSLMLSATTPSFITITFADDPQFQNSVPPQQLETCSTFCLVCIGGKSRMNLMVSVDVSFVVPSMTRTTSFCTLSSFSRCYCLTVVRTSL